MNGGDISRSTFVATRHYTGVRMQQGRVQLDADWNELVDIERHLEQTEALDVIGPTGVPKATAGFELSLAPDGTDLLLSPGRAWVGGTLCELEADTTVVTTVAGSALTVAAIVLDGAELAPHDWVDLRGDASAVTLRVIAVEAAQSVVTVDGTPDTNALGEHLKLSRRRSYATQPDLPQAPFVTQADANTPPTPTLPAGMYLAYLDVWQRAVTALEEPDLREVALGGPDTTTRSQTVWQLKLLTLEGAPAGLTCGSDLSQWTPTLAEPSGRMAARAELDQTTQNLCTPTAAGGFAGLENQLYRVQVHDVTDDGRPIVLWSRDNGSVVTAWLGNGAGAGELTVADIGKDSVLGFGASQWVELTDDVHELSGAPGTLVNLLDAKGTTLTFATSGPDAPTGSTTFTDFHGTPKARRWDSPGAVTVDFDTWIALEDGVEVLFPSGGTYRRGDYWLVPARTVTGGVSWARDSAGNPLARRPDGVAHAWGRVALVSVPDNAPATVIDCRDLFPSLTTLAASDVAYTGTACVIPGADTVQEALDQLCKEHDLRRHHRLLHGWGIVNGLQVHCAAPSQVIVQPGTAIDAEGNDLDVTASTPVDLLDLAAAVPDAVDGDGNGDVCLLLTSDPELQIGFAVEKYDKTQDEPPALLQGTLWSDFYRDNIQSLHDFIHEKLTPGPDDGVTSPARQLLSALTNVAAQAVNQTSGQNLFISPSEDKLLQQFYVDLRQRLQSDTFCAMFANARTPAAYPTTWSGMDVIFGAGSHARLRVRPGAAEAYTVGPGTNPLQPTTVINRYDLTSGTMTARIDPVAGKELAAGEKPVSGYGPVTDVAFSPDGRQIYVAVPASNEDNTFFRVGDIRPNGIDWRPSVTICGVKFVTLATAAAIPGAVYAIGLKKVTVNNKVQWQGAGLYQINPDSVDPTMSPMPFPASFNPVGHLSVLPDGRAVATSAAPGQPVTSYSSVFQFTLPNPPPEGWQIALPVSGNDDVALIDVGGAALIYTVVSQNGRSFVGNEFGNGAAVTGAPVQLQTGTGAVRLLPVGDHVVATSSDDYLLRMIDPRGGQLVPEFKLPLQVGPIAIAASDSTKRVYVLNYVSNTLWEGNDELFVPTTTFPFDDLTAYRKAMVEAFADLLYGFLQYLKDGLFDHFLVNAPEVTGNEKLYLAAVSIRSNQVYRVCNFTRRRYVKSFPLIGYWLSVVPFMPMLKQRFAEVACTVLPDLLKPYNVQTGATGSDRLSVEMLMQAVAWAQSTDVPGRVREVRNKSNVASGAAGLALRTLRPAPRPIGGRALVATDLVGKQSDAAAQIATSKGLTVETRAFDPSQGAGSVKDIAGVFRSAQPGDQVTLFTDDTGQVRYYEVVKPAPTIDIGPNTPADVITLQGQLTQAQTQLNQTLIQLTTLQTQQTQRDAELAELRSQLGTLSNAHDQLRNQIGNLNPPQ
ncbi:MAG TPA: DUF6519 domain-containing protein [Nocardioidaceae bacterium]